jgi:membrane-associated phospholipid phosphatase
MSERVRSRSASRWASGPGTAQGARSTGRARAARGIARGALACALALLLAPAHAAGDGGSAVLQVRAIAPHSAVRSVRGIGSTPQAMPAPVAADVPAPIDVPGQAGMRIADATGIAAPTQASTDEVPAPARRAERAGVTASRAAQAAIHPVAVMPAPAQARDPADVTSAPATATPAAVISAQARMRNAPATASASPTPALADEASAAGDDVPAREASRTAPPGSTGQPSGYRQPLLAAVQQAQQPAPSAVIAQSAIGAGNDILLPRAWYDTTPGRIGIFFGASAVASLADRGVKDWALRHQHDAFNRDVIKVRDILPWPAFWLAAATSFPSPWANDKLAHTSTVALTSAVLGRDRPADSNNPYNFTSFNPRYSLIYGASSFPSGHTSLTWALITPYARAYHMPWLYALGVASGAGRVMQNAHWFSDVVGGGLLGYFTARWTEEHMNPKANVQWVFTGNGLYLFKSF